MVFRRSPELLASLRASAAPSSDPLTAARAILWIALTIRKLADAEELSLEFQRRCWRVGLHPVKRGALPSGVDLQSEYELGFARDDQLSTLRLCGLLIHCCVFAATNEGVYFTSQMEKRRGLFVLDWAELGRIVDAVCEEQPRCGVIRAA